MTDSTPSETAFWANVDRTETCWLWTGDVTSKGYGEKVTVNRRHDRPHRLAYWLVLGDIPEGLHLDHLCRIRNCVNPAHLEPVTNQENTRRAVAARWHEDCPNGHPAQIYRATLPSGKNICRECRRVSDKARDDRNKDARRAAARARYAARNLRPDPVKVERAKAGQPIRLTRTEMTQAVFELIDAGLSAVQVAERLHVTARTVERIKAQARQDAA